MSKQTKILLIYTGGTIGMIKDFETGVLRAFNFNKLLERIPELHLLECEVDTYSFQNPIDSSDMNPIEWVKISKIIEENYTAYDGFVILHGSDTMSYTASALSFMLQNLNKPVILTGSQLPIGDLRTDAKENLITAIQLATLQKNGQAQITEVGLYFEYKLYRGNRTSKISAEHFHAFTSPNFPELGESGVHLNIQEHLLHKPQGTFKVENELDDRVAILKIFPGITQKVLDAFLNIEGLQGVVIETYGSGNAPTEDWFINTLKKAIDRGIKIVNITQCWGGSVDMSKYENGIALKKIGVISGGDITTEAAITKMMHLLPKHTSNESFQKAFLTPICGEMKA